MYESGPLPLPRPYAEALHQLVLRERPRVALEIGCAMGSSTLAICSALSQLGDGHLISIDPFQSTRWSDQGVQAVERAGLGEHHELIEDFDYHALPALLARGERVGVAYIDGMHTFDYTFLDAFYVDKLLDTGGVVGFNDCGWRAVHRALRCLRAHRHYQEVDVGLKRDYSGRIPLVSIAIKRVQRRCSNDRYFRKLDTFEPDTRFYARF